MAAALLTKMFGSGKKGEPPSPQMAIQKLRETEEMLSKKSEFLEKKIDKEMQSAKKHGMKNKRGESFNSERRGSWQLWRVRRVDRECTLCTPPGLLFHKPSPSPLSLPSVHVSTRSSHPHTSSLPSFHFSLLAALMALRRKKRLEKQLQQIDGTLSTIEFQREALENAQTNTEVLKNMSYAAKALKAAHSHL